MDDFVRDQLFREQVLGASLALQPQELCLRGEPSLGTSVCAIAVGFRMFLTTGSSSCIGPSPVLQLRYHCPMPTDTYQSRRRLRPCS